MKAAFIVAQNSIEIKEIPIPSITADEVLVKVKTMGICGTDLHFFKGVRQTQFPHLSGHEASGEVVAVGSLVKEIFVGERVVVDPNLHCGRCGFCRQGRFNLCKNKKVIGVSLPGCFAEYVKVKQENVWRLPVSVAHWQGALVEPLAIALHVFNTSHVRLGESIALFGAGTIGLMLLQLLKKSGIQVTIIDKFDDKLSKARELGADRTINLRKTKFQSLLEEKNTYHKVIDAAGVSETLEESVELAGAGGEVVWLGLPTSEVKINAARFIYRDLIIRSSLAYTYEFGDALRLIENGGIELKTIVTNQYSFDEIPAALEYQSKGESIKSIVLV
jgi:2-desacetyl-2-hydroxyethyl bacteriochlorophyllide A dehydrogenase